MPGRPADRTRPSGKKGPITVNRKPYPIRCGDIGPVRRKVDLEPMPKTEPVKEPAPAPVRPLEPAR